MPVSQSFVLVAVGLAFEGRIARRIPGTRVCCGRGPLLAAALEAAALQDCRGVISFGIAGGLDPDLAPGSLVIAASVIGPTQSFAADEAWSQSLGRALPQAHVAPLAGTDAAATDPAAKARLFRDTGAAAVDMESHTAAAVAARHGLPFAALRAIADPAHQRVPAAALAGLRPDGRTSVAAVMKGLLQHPGDLPGLIEVARHAARARTAINRAARRMNRGFGLPGMV